MADASAEEWLGIHALFTRYSMALDDGDVEGVIDCFTEDATVESPVVGTYAGHGEIRAFAERLAAVRQAGAQLRHLVGNLTAEVDGDRARARCYLVVTIAQDGQSKLLGPGEYNCECVKSGDRWRFTRRVVAMDHPISLPGG